MKIQTPTFIAAAAALTLAGAACAHSTSRPPSPSAREVKVLVITMFPPEASVWTGPLQLTQEYVVAGLPASSPKLLCNAQDVCLVTTGMGHANAAASVLAVTLDPRLDLRRAYFLVAGIAGIDPAQGTIASVAWARWVVDFGIAHEIDAREIPPEWSTGHLGIGTSAPGKRPAFAYETEAFRLDEALLQRALALTKELTLEDDPQAKVTRARFPAPPANQPPRVIQCDTLAGDTWWHGERLGEHARQWTKLLTGDGVYCTTQQEDTATYNALARAAAAGKVDLKRFAVMRSGANFDRPWPGLSAAESLRKAHEEGSGGFKPATANLYVVGSILVREIVEHWDRWRDGVPPAS